MQLLTLSLTTLLSTLPLLTTAHMLLDNGAVWGRNSQGSSLENPLNRQSGGNWLHHGASKDTDKFMQLTPGQPKVLPIVCGEAMRKNKQAGDLCKAKSGMHSPLPPPPPPLGYVPKTPLTNRVDGCL